MSRFGKMQQDELHLSLAERTSNHAMPTTNALLFYLCELRECDDLAKPIY